VHLTPADVEKLLLSVAGMIARDRRDRGIRLNHPEAVALLSTWVIERAREGVSVAVLMEEGRTVLGPEDVMPGVPEMLRAVQVEATFPDGRKLVTIHDPITSSTQAGPGATAVGEGTVDLNTGRKTITLVIENTGDRPIQVGAHLHLPDANAALCFDRTAAAGFRLDLPSGTSARFEPGASREVTVVALGGARRVPGIQRRT
jgi:urease subunit gamma/beta